MVDLVFCNKLLCSALDLLSALFGLTMSISVPLRSVILGFCTVGSSFLCLRLLYDRHTFCRVSFYSFVTA